MPITLTPTHTSAPTLASAAFRTASPDLIKERPLAGLRVLDLTRVIAGPVAGRTLAALGADVLWVTSPHLPSLPGLDCDMARGKRSVFLDLEQAGDAEKMRELVKGADVVIQSYRPGALAGRGWGREEVRALNSGIVYAS